LHHNLLMIPSRTWNYFADFFFATAFFRLLTDRLAAFFTAAQRLTAAFFAAADRSSGVIFAYRLATIWEPIDFFSAIAEL
jgi:hypothetical protein